MSPGEVVVENLSVARGAVLALKDVSARFGVGTLTALTGENGAGKSTLLMSIAGKVSPTEGKVFLPASAKDIAFLPQNSEIDRRFPLSTSDLVVLGLWRRLGAFRAVTMAERAVVSDCLAAVGLSGFEDRSIAALSVGQFQRALFARILLQDARIILLDEPFAAMDTITVETLVALLPRWRDEGRIVIAALHDADQIRRHFPRTLRLDKRVVYDGLTGGELVSEP